MSNIEHEVRSFISKDEYIRLKGYFDKEAKLLHHENQETYYLNTDCDLRIQKNNDYSKMWLKKGKMHDSSREEIEIHFDKNDFDKILEIFDVLNYNIKIKWLRERFEYDWDDIKVCLDNTKGYGYIIELEKITTRKDDDVYAFLTQKLESLHIKFSLKKDFEDRFSFYEKNWKNILMEK
jgi:predicted adenylyl cyclase CyaB